MTTRLTEAEIVEAEAICAAATPGPFIKRTFRYDTRVRVEAVLTARQILGQDYPDVALFSRSEDADCFIAMCDLFPRALLTIREVEGEARCLDFIAHDHPTANGRVPAGEEFAWTASFTLDDRRVLKVQMGERGFRAFEEMFVKNRDDDYRERDRLLAENSALVAERGVLLNGARMVASAALQYLEEQDKRSPSHDTGEVLSCARSMIKQATPEANNLSVAWMQEYREQLSTLKAENAALREETERLKPYIRHSPTCWKAAQNCRQDDPCICGLDGILT